MTEQIDDIERDLSRSRAELRDNVQALSEKLTVGQVIDDLLFDGQINWDKVGGATTDAMKLVLPGALIGAGAGMLLARGSISQMFNKSNGNGADRSAYMMEYYPGYDRAQDEQQALLYERLEALELQYPRAADEDEEAWRQRLRTHHAEVLGYRKEENEDEHAFGKRLNAAVDKAKSTGKSAKDRIASAASAVAHGLQRAASSTAGAVGHAASSAAGAMGHAASSTMGAMGHAASSTFGAMGHAAHSGASAAGSGAGSLGRGTMGMLKHQQETMGRQMNKAMNMYDSNPMLGVAVGLGVGALLGTLIPVSRQEREAMSEPVGKAANRVAEAGQKLAERARDATDKVHDKAEQRIRASQSQQDSQGGEMSGSQQMTTPASAI